MGVSETLSAKTVKNDSDCVDSFKNNRNFNNERSQDEDMANDQSAPNFVDEREEGEIVDDYEFIISSDEELSMRKRIEELEATNAELEKIAKISSNSDEYTVNCRRAARVPTDASSISSVEFPTPKRHKKRKSKDYKSYAYDPIQQQSKKGYRYSIETQRSNNKKHKHSSRRSYMRSIKTLEEDTYFNECLNIDRDEKYDSDCYLNQEELRLAVTRFPKSEINLRTSRKCLEIEKIKLPTHNLNANSECLTNNLNDHPIDEVSVDANSNDSVSLEEQELRLIALKSAVMKKHLARKKRDAEVAYSPTDFEDVITSNTCGNHDDDMDVVEKEIDQMEHNSKNSMDISPVASPKLNLSHEYEENSRMSMSTESTGAYQVGNTRLVDMDIATSDSESELPYYDEETKKWLPLEQIPLPTTRESRIESVHSEFHLSCNSIINPMEYSSFLPKYVFEPPPLPPDVSSFEEQPPPPPPYHLKNNTIKKDINTVSCKEHAQSWRANNVLQINTHDKTVVKRPLNSVEIAKEHVVQEREENDENDEEEKALRALLLSKFNNPKVFQIRSIKSNLSKKENTYEQGTESEKLSCSISPKILEKNSSANPSETILKEAVRRLTLKISSIHSEYNKGERENCNSKIDRTLKSPIEGEASTKIFDHVSKSTNSNGKVNVLVLNDTQNILVSKDIEFKPHHSDIICSNHNTADSKANRARTIKVRSVKKINSSVCVENMSKSPETDKNTNTTSMNGRKFTNGLYVEDNSNNLYDDRLNEKERPENFEVSRSKKNTLKLDTQENSIQEISSNQSDAENMINKVDIDEIVKRNRNLNKIMSPQSETKRKIKDSGRVTGKVAKTVLKSDSQRTTSHFQSSSNSSRLILNTDISKIQVNKLVISLRASDSDASDEELLKNNSNVCINEPYLERLQPLTCSINNENYDNASPISLPMYSPVITPNRSNSPAEDVLVAKSGLPIPLVNDCFKEKLDSFLKNVRTQVQHAVCQPIKNEENETQFVSTASSKKFFSSVALSHLPLASQQEYKRLVRRMELLEKQKQLRRKDKPTTVTHTMVKANDKMNTCLIRDDHCRPVSQKSPIENQPNVPKIDFVKGISEKSLCKKVLIKNTNHTPPIQKVCDRKLALKNQNTAPHKSSKLNVLRAYESSFLKIGTGIVTNLDKSLQLVAEAKNAKIEKLQYEKKFQELRSEMEEVEQKMKHAQQKLSRVYPEICESNELITTLKQRRNKLLKAATSLGKVVKGADYRLNNDLKQQITMKSKLLAGQIKCINSMKCSDIEKGKEILKNETSSFRANLNNDTNLHTEHGCRYDKQCSENVLILSETESDRSDRNIKPTKVPTILFKDSSENGLNEFSNKNNINESKISSTNEYNYKQEKGLSEPTERNDVAEKSSEIEGRTILIEDQSSSTDEKQSTNLVPEYISPLLPLKPTKRTLDPNGIVCPYELMGECEDKDCNYVHINVK